jgi:hypothetical protein
VIVLFVTLTEAEALLNVAQRAGLVSVSRQLFTWLPAERRTPLDDPPALVVQYGGPNGVGHDVYDADWADAMWEAMSEAKERVEQVERDRAPLFAEGKKP